MRKVLLTSMVLFFAGATFWMGGCAKSESAGIGKEFSAELTTLDGEPFSIPKDTKGKVVVVDFWASWCSPCRTQIPHMKELHEKYKDKGVVIVGISLDTDKNALKKFITDRKMDWVQTYSGKRWNDPTSQKYGISGIPSVWVIGKDGKVISTDAVTNTSKIIDKALKD